VSVCVKESILSLSTTFRLDIETFPTVWYYLLFILIYTCSTKGCITLLTFCLGLIYGFYRHFNNISAISWRSVLLVEETGVPGENQRPFANHRQTLSHNVAPCTHRHEQGSNSQR